MIIYLVQKKREFEGNIPPMPALRKFLDLVNQIEKKTVPGWGTRKIERLVQRENSRLNIGAMNAAG